jgi:hypothetical protein
MVVPDHGIKRTNRNALHATPAATHINKWRLVAINYPKCVATADFPCQAFIACSAKSIIYFKH